jgi:hypothetical protein
MKPDYFVSLTDSSGDSFSLLNPLPVATLAPPIAGLYSFNNFGTFTHRGWTMNDTLLPVLSVRTKSASTSVCNILSYEVGNNNAASSTYGYVWIENATITGTLPAWQSLNTQAEYQIYTDAYGSNTPNGFTGGTRRHSGIGIGKSSDSESDLSTIKLIGGSDQNMLTLCLMRLDSATKLDVWFSIDTGILV